MQPLLGRIRGYMQGADKQSFSASFAYVIKWIDETSQINAVLKRQHFDLNPLYCQLLNVVLWSSIITFQN